MEPICAECTFDYRSLAVPEAPSVLRRETYALAEVLVVRRPIATVPEGTWSALEYAGHIRDVLLVARERTLNTKRESGAVVVTMAPDERVTWGEYEGLTAARASEEIVQTGEWLALTWERLSDEEWGRMLLYNYPEPEFRALSWLASHIVHELVHHRLDIERLTVSA